MISNVPLAKRGAPIFYGEIDLRLLIITVRREGICNFFRFVSLCSFSKILVVFWSHHMHLVWQLQQLQFYCAAGLLCYQEKNGCRLYSRELLLSSPKPRGSVPAEPPHICWHIQILDPWGVQGIAECLLWYPLSRKFLNSVPSQHTCAYVVWRVSRGVRTRLITLLWNVTEVSLS